ncbi:hypothetical protein LP419_20485 [Massilia sp. H-1]|nr:hypothetical protein LP419_20485 [Massilia sp. H-1]
MRGVDGVVDRAVHAAAKRDPGGADAGQDGVEGILADPETVVGQRDRALAGVEVEGQPRVHEDRREGADPRLGPGHAQQTGQQPGRGDPVPGRNQNMVELDCHARCSRCPWPPTIA